jgi:hypothetical protein
MRKMTKVAITGLLAMALLAPTAAFAKDGDVVRTGNCSAASDWKLKLSPENSSIETEIEVDQNVVGQVWKVKVFHNGTLEYKFRKTTVAPSGSFTARRLVGDEAGKDRIRVRAVNIGTGEACGAFASI